MPGAFFFQAVSASINNERLAIVFGFITLMFGLGAFLSCRVCISLLSRLGIKNPAGLRGYSTFYRYHLYYWWAFGVALMAHIMVATLHTGLPKAGDPDAGVHWVILGLGLFSGVSAATSFCSCRVFPRLMAMIKPENPFGSPFYKAFFKYHSYYWLILALLVAAHFSISYSHAGIWP